jgi:hypothetical protein
MVNGDQQHTLLKQTLNKTGNVGINVTLWCRCVTIGDVEKL